MIKLEKPYSQACENNKSPILKVLSKYLSDATRVLEIGFSTEHAVHLPAIYRIYFGKPVTRFTTIRAN